MGKLFLKLWNRSNQMKESNQVLETRTNRTCMGIMSNFVWMEQVFFKWTEMETRIWSQVVWTWSRQQQRAADSEREKTLQACPAWPSPDAYILSQATVPLGGRDSDTPNKPRSACQQQKNSYNNCFQYKHIWRALCAYLLYQEVYGLLIVELQCIQLSKSSCWKL